MNWDILEPPKNYLPAKCADCFTTQEYAGRWHISRRTAHEKLSQMELAGLIQRVKFPQNGSMRYGWRLVVDVKTGE